MNKFRWWLFRKLNAAAWAVCPPYQRQVMTMAWLAVKKPWADAAAAGVLQDTSDKENSRRTDAA